MQAMIYRIGSLELNESTRQITLDGRELRHQPKVFDTLAYLISQRERVVSKEELLHALWSDSIVVDNAIHKAISAARRLLKESGLPDAIRTYARQGYRFCAPMETATANTLPTPAPRSHRPSVAQDPRSSGPPSQNACDQASRALASRHWDEAISVFQQADREHALGPDALQQWAQAVECVGRPADAIPLLFRAASGYAMAGRSLQAAAMATKLSFIHFERQELAVSQGWLKRARQHLAGQTETKEYGLCLWMECRIKAATGDPENALRLVQEARILGQRLADHELEALALVYQGFCRISLGQTREGIEDQDHGAAIVLGGAASPTISGIVYCAIIWACRNLADWPRASQWTDSFSLWCAQSGILSYPGVCQLHRSESLLIQGKLDDAFTTVQQAINLLAATAPWCVGDAYRVLGELQLAQGNLPQARKSFLRSQQEGWDPQPGYALLLWQEGDTASAIRSLQRALGDRGWLALQRNDLLLAHLACIAAHSGRGDLAEESLARLASRFRHWSTPYIEALADLAAAELCRQQGQVSGAIENLARARQKFQQSHASLEAIKVRLLAAQWLIDAKDRTGAALELAEAEALAQRSPIPHLEQTLYGLKCALASPTKAEPSCGGKA